MIERHNNRVRSTWRSRCLTRAVTFAAVSSTQTFSQMCQNTTVY